MQSSFPLGLIIIYTVKVIFLKCQIVSLLEYKKNVKADLMVNVKMATLSAKFDLSIALSNHYQHGLLSFLSSLPISVLRNLE